MTDRIQELEAKLAAALAAQSQAEAACAVKDKALEAANDVIEMAGVGHCWRGAYKATISDAIKAAMSTTPGSSLLAEVERLRNPWQDIATAPKDGTRILVWRASYKHPFIVRFRNGHWLESDCVIHEPTHWQPLTPPLSSPPAQSHR